ncbi:hypothetical protein JEQ12_013267 [Ovis aries]|uniref:C2H2-type domain-containing protein n=1 Tax=Ovis aries TaxID=9940 RepID=A0A836CPV0_SHEEP|nr:hypothetical protein JEQ12_013267 [Ovis aries]
MGQGTGRDLEQGVWADSTCLTMLTRRTRPGDECDGCPASDPDPATDDMTQGKFLHSAGPHLLPCQFLHLQPFSLVRSTGCILGHFSEAPGLKMFGVIGWTFAELRQCWLFFGNHMLTLPWACHVGFLGVNKHLLGCYEVALSSVNAKELKFFKPSVFALKCARMGNTEKAFVQLFLLHSCFTKTQTPTGPTWSAMYLEYPFTLFDFCSWLYNEEGVCTPGRVLTLRLAGRSLMKSSDIDQDLFTDSYCKVCSAQLISESQRVAHYEVLLFPLDLSPAGNPVGFLCLLNLSLLISEVPSRDANTSEIESRKHASKVRLYYMLHPRDGGCPAKRLRSENSCVRWELALFPTEKKTEMKSFDSGQTATLITGNDADLVDKNKCCTLCNMSFTSAVVADSHYQGKIHAKRLKLLLGEKTPLKTTATPLSSLKPPRVDTAPVTPSPYQRRDSDRYCGLCAAWFNNPLMAQQHYDGKKHKKNAARVALLEQLGTTLDMGELREKLVFPRVKALLHHTSIVPAWQSLFFNCNQFCECRPVSYEEKICMASLMTEAKKLAQKSGTFRKGPRSLTLFLADGDGDPYKIGKFLSVFSFTSPIEF